MPSLARPISHALMLAIAAAALGARPADAVTLHYNQITGHVTFEDLEDVFAVRLFSPDNALAPSAGSGPDLGFNLSEKTAGLYSWLSFDTPVTASVVDVGPILPAGLDAVLFGDFVAGNLSSPLQPLFGEKTTMMPAGPVRQSLGLLTPPPVALPPIADPPPNVPLPPITPEPVLPGLPPDPSLPGIDPPPAPGSPSGAVMSVHFDQVTGHVTLENLENVFAVRLFSTLDALPPAAGSGPDLGFSYSEKTAGLYSWLTFDAPITAAALDLGPILPPGADFALYGDYIAGALNSPLSPLLGDMTTMTPDGPVRQSLGFIPPPPPVVELPPVELPPITGPPPFVPQPPAVTPDPVLPGPDPTLPGIDDPPASPAEPPTIVDPVDPHQPTDPSNQADPEPAQPPILTLPDLVFEFPGEYELVDLSGVIGTGERIWHTIDVDHLWTLNDVVAWDFDAAVLDSGLVGMQIQVTGAYAQLHGAFHLTNAGGFTLARTVGAAESDQLIPEPATVALASVALAGIIALTRIRKSGLVNG